MDVFQQLAAPFPPDAISWRAQSLTADKTKAMALAYIDARDVMDRLDAVVGPANWQDSYSETPKGRLICTLSIRADGEWISKSDGAGDTDVEGDKGAISDSLKRAAVKWGIGRYLYDIKAPWAECEVGSNGKWKKWTANGLRTLQQCLPRPGASPNVTPIMQRADQVPDGDPLVTDTQRDWLIAHAEASVGTQKLLDHYRKTTMKDFRVSELTGARDWCKQQKEAA